MARTVGEVRVGAVRGRYYRENFAQGGVDLVQIIPELVTNADAAIAAGEGGRAGQDRAALRSPPGRVCAAMAQPDARAWGARPGGLAL